eukprot:scaffold574759_cov43-Prasinocladus_malaysianus.AAC.1
MIGPARTGLRRSGMVVGMLCADEVRHSRRRARLLFSRRWFPMRGVTAESRTMYLIYVLEPILSCMNGCRRAVVLHRPHDCSWLWVLLQGHKPDAAASTGGQQDLRACGL